MRVVLDANVYVSSLLTQQGNARQILSRFEEGEFELLTSDPILAEIKRVLAYPHIVKIHKKSSQEIAQFIAALRETTDVVAPKITLSIVSGDESDNRYIECAVEGNADYLVTGDKKHLLPIREYAGIQVLPPASFLVLLNS